ncbi:aromatic ring-hydroxylating dioxygenase subunit alpha [Mesorhizobium sp. M1348]|uniref:aromatic ring-hydroxylating oxygenase subunit alpha n=1 Tax=Mesorhizobium sp. M1348 TaxID=2957089 RepID=UPI003335B664
MSVEGLAARQREGHSLERAFYVDRNIFERDLEAIFAKQWLLVDHVSSIPVLGDYVTYEIAGESIVVVRGANGHIHAHYNVCRHRGSRVCLASEGMVRTFTCPYHGWVYGLDGRLIHAKNMGEGFDRSQWALHSCHVRVCEGLIFIFIGAEEDAPDFSAIEAEMLPILKPHGLTRAKIAHTEIYATPGNWKLAVENFRECYHCAMSHPEYTAVNSFVKINDAAPGSFERTVLPAWEETERELGHVSGAAGLEDGPQPCLARRQPIQEGWQTLSQDGQPVAPLMGTFKEFDGAETHVWLGTQSAISCTSDHVTLFRFTPVDPTHTEVRLTWLVDKDAKEGVDYDVDRLKWMWHVTTLQDTQLITDNQLGVNSRRYTPGPYSVRESRTSAFISWYLGRLTMDNSGADSHG